MRRIISILTVLLCLGACVPGHNDYSEFKNIPVEGWCYNDTLTFTPGIADSVADGMLTIAVRHSGDYIYSNLWMEVRYTDGDNEKTDTLNIVLADIYGHWHGHGLGASFQMSDTVSTSCRITRNTPVKVRHIMRADTLRAVEQVGIIFLSDESEK